MNTETLIADIYRSYIAGDNDVDDNLIESLKFKLQFS